MSADALKRLIVAVGGLFTAIFFVLTNKDLDPVMVQKVVDAVVWIVGLYLAQSGGKAAVREWAASKFRGPVIVQDRPLVGVGHALPFNPNAAKPSETP